MSEQIENKAIKKKSKKGFFIFLAIVAVIVGIIIGNKISDCIESKKVGEALDIQAYHDTVDSNKIRASETYLGNRYSVTGTIVEIDGGIIIQASSEEDIAANKFVFYAYDIKDYLELSKGQRVTATGTLTGLPHIWGGYFENAVFSVE